MKTLSPAAQAFLIAAYRLPLNDGQPDLAAALEALAYYVAQGLEHDPQTEWQIGASDMQRQVRSEILSIAAELRSTDTP